MRRGMELALLRLECARLRKQNDWLVVLLQQARRDADLLAAGWRDRRAALAFLHDLHRIDGINDGREVA